MAGKHVDWRVVDAFPDYEINPIGEVRKISNGYAVPQFQQYGEWAYNLGRIVNEKEERWVVTKKSLIEVTFFEEPKQGESG